MTEDRQKQRQRRRQERGPHESQPQAFRMQHLHSQQAGLAPLDPSRHHCMQTANTIIFFVVSAVHVSAVHVSAVHVSAVHVSAVHVSAVHVSEVHVPAVYVSAVHVSAVHVSGVYVSKMPAMYIHDW